ncbi:MAG: hypothetical protein A2W93_04490 [Bacteroidetes bacterium GWF2_43_63]|nr:MAG: hypothetical protein A2W94_12480 [Bacteroidetes bacterium GWE2_42_42]OFY56019.1 MAG: hypothetical protein A2W93_04490 [Bacteroidetes bacterium GWF2_43_63]
MSIKPDSNAAFHLFIDQAMDFAAETDEHNIFAENDRNYHQSSSNVYYMWDFGDGTVEVGPFVSHSYQTPGHFIVSMNIVDNNNCSSDTLRFSVLTIAPPQVSFNFSDFYCISDTLFISIGSDTANNISIVPQEQTGQDVFLYKDTTLFIPDGPSCSTLSVNVPFLVNTGNPATIVGPDAIRSVCVNMEHSFAGDLSFQLTCPDSITVVLDSYDNSGSSNLGIANTTDGTPTCDSAANPPGTGWLYCWSDYYNHQGIMNNLDAGTNPIPPTDTINNTGYIYPENSLVGFASGGCHLDGIWTLTITDSWVYDNGYLFGIQMSLKNNSTDTAAVLTDTIITGPGIVQLPGGQWAITGIPAGTFQYHLVLHDSLGNNYSYPFPVTFTANDFATEIHGNGTTDVSMIESYNTDYHQGADYLWTVTNGNVVNGQGTDSIQVLWQNSGTGLIQVAETIGNCTDFDSLYVSIVGLNELNANDYLSVSPNPVENTLCIDALQTISDIEIFDISGQSTGIHIGNVLPGSKTYVPVSNLSPGIYFIRGFNKGSRKEIIFMKQ